MFIAIIGATAIIGALALFWWGITATPSRARANLFAGLDISSETPKTSYLRQIGTATRRFIPHPLVDGLEIKLVQAGHPYGLDLPRILGVKFTLAVVSAGFMFLVGQPLLALVVAPLLFFLPDYAVASMKDKRQDQMRRKSADMIDQMTICVEAGLGFDAAVNRVASTNDGPLAEELRRTIADLRAGMPRQQALRALGDRAQIEEVRHLVTALIQAQRHGVPLAEILRAQSREMRIRKKQRTEEKAAKLGVKIVFPVLVCFMPVFFVILLGPSLAGLMSAFKGG
jgi:tight adherence protein C